MAWKSIETVTEEVEQYIEDRAAGKITSCRTGYKKLDDSNLDGIEYGSTVTLGGRPSSGKTVVSSCILKGILNNNPLEDLAILDFNWEMASKALLIRDLSADTELTYKEILSAGNTLSKTELGLIHKYLNKYKTLPIYFEEEPKTSKEFANAVRKKRDELDKIGKKKLIVRIDHTILAKRMESEAGQVEMLHNLLFQSNIVKKESEIIFIFLTQMNRLFEDRQEDGTDKAFPKQSDVFGGDATSMFSEIMLLLNRPSKYGITYYGKRPNGVAPEKDDLFLHCVKNRNAEPDLVIKYKTAFSTMSMIEC